MRYVVDNEKDLKQMLKELSEIDGVTIDFEFTDDGEEFSPVEVQLIFRLETFKIELERALILLEEQNEVDLAIEKLYGLYHIIEQIEMGVIDFEV